MFVFESGSVVFWGFSTAQEARLLDELSQFCTQNASFAGRRAEAPFDSEEFDVLKAISANVPPVQGDVIFLRETTPEDATLERLALSHAVQRSVKLGVVEQGEVLQAGREERKQARRE